MKKFIINISYSWGDEEEPIEIEAENKYKALGYMCDLAVKELCIELQEWPEYSDNNAMKVFENKIILHYGHDDEECYYELEEV